MKKKEEEEEEEEKKEEEEAKEERRRGGILLLLLVSRSPCSSDGYTLYWLKAHDRITCERSEPARERRIAL